MRAVAKKAGTRAAGRAGAGKQVRPTAHKAAGALPVVPLAGVLFLVGLCAAIVAQGIYYPFQHAWLGFGAVAAIVCVVVVDRCSARALHLPFSCLCLLGIGVFCLVSGAAHGLTLTHVAGALPWFTAFGVGVLCAQMTLDGRDAALRALGYVGFGACAFALLLLCQALPMPGTITDGRLQFSVQYANTAAALFAAFFFVQMLSADARLNRLALFSLAMLLFTQSGGMVAIFMVAMLAMLVRWLVARDYDQVLDVLLQAIFAMVGFGACLLVGISWSALTVPVAFGLYLGVRWLCGERFGSGAPAALAWGLLGAVVAAAVAVVVLVAATGRISLALGTFAERFVQMHDGWAMLMQDPILGLGPDEWQFQYRLFQTMQYNTMFVHNSYLQLWLDGGLGALACFCAFAVLGVRALFRQGRAGLAICALALLAHGFIDIDFQYGSFLMLLVFLLMAPGQPELPARAAFPAVLASAVVVCAACVCGLLAYNSIQYSKTAANQGAYGYVESVLADDALAQADPQVRTSYVAALTVGGEYGRAVQAFEQWKDRIQDEAWMNAAFAYHGAGDDAGAIDTALTQIEREVGKHPGFEFARYILYCADADEAAWRRYAEAARHANEVMDGGLPADVLPRRREHEALTDEDRERFDAIRRGESGFAYEETYWTGA